MEWVFFMIVVLGFVDVETKLSKLLKNSNIQNKNLDLKMLKELVGKDVNIIVENDNINNSFLFSPQSKTKGIIKEYNEKWLLFEYENKKEIINQYFRISDITSINEIK